MLDSLTGSIIQETLTLSNVALCTITSLILGLLISCVYMAEKKYNKGFVETLALLPVMVQVVIMLVNGNLGAGVAVAGAFSLIRFRSVAGSARDIGTIFFAMVAGLATGMGYLFYAVFFSLVIGLANVLLSRSRFGSRPQAIRILKITIPENLDYEALFDDLFEQYTSSAELDRVKTTNMGSLYELSYEVQLKSNAISKKFLDELRCRNGNLNIVIARPASQKDEL